MRGYFWVSSEDYKFQRNSFQVLLFNSVSERIQCQEPSNISVLLPRLSDGFIFKESFGSGLAVHGEAFDL